MNNIFSWTGGEDMLKIRAKASIVRSMAGCGKHWNNLCGARQGG